jgi:hypothetical protein
MNTLLRHLRLSLSLTPALTAVLAALALAGSAWAAAPITLDGAFADWSGHSMVGDPIGDADGPVTDLTALYFATNPDDPTAFFMVERLGGNKPLDLVLYIDANDNGVYTEAADRQVRVVYNPQGSRSSVDVDLYDGTGQFLAVVASDVDWGESGEEGGQRVEWGVAFADLGMLPGQPLRMYLVSMQGNKISDGTTEVQWSPANALGWAIVVAILAGGSLWMGVMRKRSKEAV